MDELNTIFAATVTREILWNIPGWARALMYLLFLAAVALCLMGVARRVRYWRQGREAGEPVSLGKACRRLWRDAVLQVRIWRSGAAGLGHALVFWGFIVLFLGTCIVAVEDYGSWLLGREHLFFTGTFYLAVSFALEVFGIFFLLGLVVALSRRKSGGRLRPLSRPVDLAVLWLFLVIGLSGFATEGLRIAAAGGGLESHPFERWSFVGWWLATGLQGLDGNVLTTLHLGSWLGHMVLSMAFIALIPYCKLRHIFFAPVNIALREDRKAGRYLGVSMEEVEETGRYGAAVAADFTRRQLMSFDACTECARCQTVCPATATGKPLSPMKVVLDIAGSSGGGASLHGDEISPDVLWACTSCGACVEECPVYIDQLGAIVDLRRHLVAEGEIRGSAQAALRSVAAAGNPWGMPQEDRGDWADGLGVPTIDEVDSPELLFWIGCAGSYDRRSRKVTEAMVRILQAAGVRFAILGKGECCTGDPARRMGDEFTYNELAGANIESLSAASFERILTTCPHCFNAIRNEYPDLGGDYDVVHHSEFIEELIASGRLVLEDGAPVRGTLHDPCYLARQNDVVEAPRSVLRSTGLDVVEPEQSGKAGFCCGAGGGRMWMEEDTGERINSERWSQLEETEPETVAVGCPFCMTMMTDARDAVDSSVEVKDIAELVAERLPGSLT